jgi:hypothetical protein
MPAQKHLMFFRCIRHNQADAKRAKGLSQGTASGRAEEFEEEDRL